MTVDKGKMDLIFNFQQKEEFSQNPVAILLQNFPDPDCLGAAAGFSLLLKEIYNLDSKIFHYGEISHPQNKSMINILHINVSQGDEFKIENVCKTVVLDTDLSSTGFDGIEKVDVRIDHHSMDRDEEPSLKDVRQVGSTSSIVWEYLKEFNIDLSEHNEVATALALGIKTDTLDFTTSTTTELDMEAFRNLLPVIDKSALAKLTNYSIPKLQFEIESFAFAKKEIKEGVLVSFIGEVNPHNRDLISTIADRFARMDTINTVVILGIIDNNLIASVRSADARVNVTKLVSDVFGKKFSGAKEGSGGGRVPLGVGFESIHNNEVKEQVMLEIVSSVKEKIFKFFGEK